MEWPAVLSPAGPNAAQIAQLFWILIFVISLVMAVVCVGLAAALFGSARVRAILTDKRTILSAGLGVPALILTVLLTYSLILTRNLSSPNGPDFMRVRVTGEMWWWRIAYLDNNGNITLSDANELHIPVGKTVAIELDSADVIHSFWVPQLAGKEDMIPGRRNILRLSADKAGVYAGQCAEFCGGPHALMGLTVIAHSPEAFDDWQRGRLIAPIAPQNELAIKGADLFLKSGCAACHIVRGTAANGQAGPDLTFVGARLKLGAGILPNNRGTLAGWVADSQAIKPGNRMPSYPMLLPAELQAIAAYLEQLR